MTFNKWLQTFIEEKGVSYNDMEVEGPSGLNFIPLSVLIDAIKQASKDEQEYIKNTLVMIDFKNGDVMHFFKHLAKAIAK